MITRPSLLIIFGLLFLFCAKLYSQTAKNSTQNFYYTARSEVYDGPTKPDFNYLSEKLWEARDYCEDNGLNTEAAIFIDLGMHSGYNRCWVIRFNDGVVRYKGLVTHGSGKEEWLPMGQRKYSNEKGSLLSSLGKYKTGKSYYGQYGLAYKLHGLEVTNSNAHSRAVVLHGHDCVIDYESSAPLCQSWGCPTVSHSFLKKLQTVIDASEKPLLLWIFDSTREGYKK
jgi:hypothetical protein